MIGRTVRTHGLGGYEPEVLALMCAYIEESAGEVRLLDIGANIGLFSMVTNALFGERLKATAFEPLPVLARFIESNVRRNKLRVDLRECALSDRAGRARFYVSQRSDTSNSLNEKFRPHRDVIDVQVSTLDALYPNGDRATYLLKIDTESTEPDVLEGARGFIARHRPPIICEVLANRTEDRLESFFAEFSYVPVHITAAPDWDGSVAVKGDETYTFRDWLFVPEVPSPAVRERFVAWHTAISTDVPDPSGS